MKPIRTDRPKGFSDAKRERLLKSVSEDCSSKVGVFRRVFDGKASPRQAIKAQCLHCTWMDEAAIRECTATQCPLWGFRPYQQKNGDAK